MADDKKKKEFDLKKAVKDYSRIFVKANKNLLTFAALSAGALFGFGFLSSTIRTANYAEPNQVESIAGDLDCDLTPITFNLAEQYHRMKHNNGDPILVAFDGEHTEEQKQAIINSLDHVFGIVNQINSNYHYKIVSLDEANMNALLGKTIIRYKVVNEPDSYAAGYINRVGPLATHITQKPLYSTFTIHLNESNINEANPIESTYLHELLHAFGFDDTYDTHFRDTDKYYGTSAMNIADHDPIMHPNDVKILLSLYAKELKEENYDKYISTAKQLLKEYDDFYYEYAAEKCKNNCIYPDKVVEIDNLDHPIKTNFTRTRIYEDGFEEQFTYAVEVYNGFYILEVLDVNGNVIDHCEGDTYLKNGVVFLRDVDLNNGISLLTCHHYSDGYTNDFNLLKLQGNEYHLFLDNNNDFISTKQFYVEDEMGK